MNKILTFVLSFSIFQIQSNTGFFENDSAGISDRYPNFSLIDLVLPGLVVPGGFKRAVIIRSNLMVIVLSELVAKMILFIVGLKAFDEDHGKLCSQAIVLRKVF